MGKLRFYCERKNHRRAIDDFVLMGLSLDATVENNLVQISKGSVKGEASRRFRWFGEFERSEDFLLSRKRILKGLSENFSFKKCSFKKISLVSVFLLIFIN